MSGKGYDYIRILCEVGWDGNDIRPDWPDYQDIMKELIDFTYDECGIRVEPTLMGGGTDHDPLDVASKMVEVSRGREHKIMHWEAANESFQNGPDRSTVRRMALLLSKTGIPTGTSCSEANDQLSFLNGVGNVAIGHLDRQEGDFDWRFVRQSWDWKDLPYLTTQNEPKGPRSSVSQCEDPLRLVMARAVGILCGMGAYVLHNGTGVTGKVDSARNRPANLWEVPNIGPIMNAVRGLDLMLPAGIENWQKTSQHGGTDPVGPHPLLADAIWSDDNNDHGVSRCYGATNGSDWISMPYGILAFTYMTARKDCSFVAYNPVTREVEYEGNLKAGERMRLAGADHADAAYIIVGKNA